MRTPITTFKSESFFQKELLIYMNRATEDFNQSLHNHDFLELAYIAEGGGFHHISDEVIKVRKGELCYIPIGVSHVFRPVSTDKIKHPLIVYNCVFSRELLTKLAFFSSNVSMQHFIEGLHNGSTAYFSVSDQEELIEKLFMSMHREFTMPREGSSDLLHILLFQLLIVIQRMMLGEHPNLIPEKQLTQFDHLLSYIDQHFSDELTLSHLAQISQWSERHLQRLFIKHTEQPFTRYLQSLRIQKSRELLRSSPQLKISVIAEMVGYKDMGSFLSVFTRIVGMTPSQYRHPKLIQTQIQP